jgi:hypothetical protein
MYMVVSIVGAAETVMRGTTTEAKKQNVEDGQFSLFVPMKESEWDALTDKGITLEKMFFLDYDVDGDKTLRVFKNRTKIDTIAIHAGKLAQADDELVLERQYAEKNDIHVGDTIVLGDRTYKVSGIGTVPDYDSPLKSLGDTVCDSLNFGLAFVTDEAYTILQTEGKSEKSEEYYYAYKLNDAMTDDELKAELKKLSFSSDDVDDVYFQEYWDRTLGREEEFRDGINEFHASSCLVVDDTRCTLGRNCLGRYLARVFEIEEPVKKYAFVIGNIMPDVNKCSYIHGYFQLLRAHRQQKDAGPLSLNDHRRMLIGGHTAEGSRFFVNRVYRVLRKREKLSVRDYYQMGKATHYLADRFTYPHTMRYTSGFFAHIRYEKQLHIYMRDMLAVLPNMRDAVDKCFSRTSFNSLYRSYRKEPEGNGTVLHDCFHILAVCIAYLENILYNK